MQLASDYREYSERTIKKESISIIRNLFKKYEPSGGLPTRHTRHVPRGPGVEGAPKILYLLTQEMSIYLRIEYLSKACVAMRTIQR